jgi:hypothetical protein
MQAKQASTKESYLSRKQVSKQDSYQASKESQ